VEFDAAGRKVRVLKGLPGLPFGVQRLPNGNTLVAVASRENVLVELDQDGRDVWKCNVKGYAADAERLANGRTLVAFLHTSQVVEIDAAGRTVWELPGVEFPYSVQRLANGNTLVCEIRARRVAEFTRDGKVVWQHVLAQGCASARRLPDGRTLVSTRGGVLFVHRDGREVWLVRGQGAMRTNFH
jgi:hypothetical protein